MKCAIKKVLYWIWLVCKSVPTAIKGPLSKCDDRLQGTDLAHGLLFLLWREESLTLKHLKHSKAAEDVYLVSFCIFQCSVLFLIG